MGGKSAECSEGERPDIVGNAQHPITPKPIRGLGAGVTASPPPNEPSHAPIGGPMCRILNIRRPKQWQREVTHDVVVWHLARASGLHVISDM